MISWIMRHPINLFTITALTAVVVAWSASNLTGYCYKEGKVLSEEELYRGLIASSRIMNFDDSQKRFVERKIGEEISELRNYQSVDEFLEFNPDCCWMSEKGLNPKWHTAYIKRVPYIWRLMGWAWKSILVNVRAYYKTNVGEQKFYTFQWGYWVNKCGEFVKAPYKYFV